MSYQCQICSKTIKPSRVKRLIPVHNGIDGTECPASRYVAGEEGAWLTLHAKLDATPAPEITFTAEEIALLEDYGYEVETCTPKSAREAYGLACELRGNCRVWETHPVASALVKRLDP